LSRKKFTVNANPEMSPIVSIYLTKIYLTKIYLTLNVLCANKLMGVLKKDLETVIIPLYTLSMYAKL